MQDACATLLTRHCEGEIVAIAAAVTRLQVVPVQVTSAPFSRLLKVPLIGVAAVF
jgi:predicted DNA-binding helix-hairpin-helix protein